LEYQTDIGHNSSTHYSTLAPFRGKGTVPKGALYGDVTHKMFFVVSEPLIYA